MVEEIQDIVEEFLLSSHTEDAKAYILYVNSMPACVKSQPGRMLTLCTINSNSLTGVNENSNSLFHAGAEQLYFLRDQRSATG